MKNRAKCKLCNEIIESLALHDYVTCKCGEIAVSGGSYHLYAYAKNFDNFLRVDDDENLVAVEYHEKKEDEKEEKQENAHTLSRQELIEELRSLRDIYKDLHSNEMFKPVTHSDLSSLIGLLYSILSSE